MVGRGLKRGQWGMTANEFGISLGDAENVLELVLMIIQSCD